MSAPARLELPRWPCWVAAGVAALAAGYLATTAGTWQHYAGLLLADARGPALLILRAPRGAPLGLFLLAVLLLAAALRPRTPRALLLAGPLLVTLLACTLCTSHVALCRKLQAGMRGELARR